MMEGSLLQLLILSFILLSKLMRGYGAVDSLSLGGSLRWNETILSQNGTFELGFFNSNGTNNWYLGIWYAKIPDKVYVWVANREIPVKNMPGILNLSRNSQLGLFDAEGASLWSANGTKAVSAAVLLDSGNFIMVGTENKSEIVWESFDHPVDTLLPGMKLGGGTKLISWRNSMDPAPGIFSLEIDPSGVSQFVMRWNDSVQYWESGVWDGKAWANIPEMAGRRYVYNMENTTSGTYLSFTVPVGFSNDFPRFVMDKAGGLMLYTMIEGKRWNMYWSQPRDQCEVYGLCGVYGTCNSNNIQFCSCLRGFEPRDEKAWGLKEWWSDGCVRRSPLNCNAKNGSSSDRLIDLNVWLPDNNGNMDRSYAATWNDCEKACLGNCSCTALKYMSNVCQIWRGDFLNMRNGRPQNTSAVFIRLPASEFESSSSSKGRRRKIATVVGIVVACTIVLAILACFFRWRCRMRWNVDATTSIRMFTYKELQISTNNFTHHLGSGAFGSVFRGTLPDHTLVAVKDLQGQGQGEKQFRAEINTVGNINHVNLIRLQGFCAEKSRRLLVYDYMPNGSLNTFLFSNQYGSKVEDWKTRFEIALGVARGLAYLHEECKERIIHCDVKPENILLDVNFCPKLADFGLAKLVGRDFSRVLTTTRGTRGYLAPEWIAGLPITPKADVYSFGMTLLEIISGRRNLDLGVQESSKFYFPTWASTQIMKKDIMSVVDSRIGNSADEEEVRRAAVVSILCIQDDEAARPSMGQVLLMLEGKMELSTPQIPMSLFTLLDHQGDGGGGNEQGSDLAGGSTFQLKTFSSSENESIVIY